jgi:RNA polymerase sigma-70 factor (ECF subfamily)
MSAHPSSVRALLRLLSQHPPFFSCNFAAPAGVLGSNDEPKPVHNDNAGLAPTEDFTTFMRRYQDMVFSTSARITGNDSHAEDISQEVFLKAFERWDSLCGNPAAGGWLKTEATNLSINHIQRYRNRWRFFSEFTRHDDEGSEDQTPIEFAAPDTFFSEMDQQERQGWVEEALAQLPEHQRVPLVLFHFDDMPYDEIARRLGVSLAKVKTDILRARAALAKILSRGPGREAYAS